jgi:hypothetical protein
MLRSKLGQLAAIGGGLLLLTTHVASPQQPAPTAAEYPTPDIREQQTVTIDGAPEVWELRWKSPPKPACEPNDVSLTCPGAGFAYGEAGELELIRKQVNSELDRLPPHSAVRRTSISRNQWSNHSAMEA